MGNIRPSFKIRAISLVENHRKLSDDLSTTKDGYAIDDVSSKVEKLDCWLRHNMQRQFE